MNVETTEHKASVIFAGLLPHAPVLIPEIGGPRGNATGATVEAMKQLAARVVSARPEAIVVISPHSPRKRRTFGIWGGDRLRGDFAEFGFPEVAIDLPNDVQLAAEMQNFVAEAGLGIREIPPWPLDHGAMVPLWHVVNAGWTGPGVVLGLCDADELEMTQLGHALEHAAGRVGRRVAVLASGDMSHRLARHSPGGFEPRAQEFDLGFIKLLGEGDYRSMRGMEPELVMLAGEDVIDSTLVAAAAVGWDATGHEVLSYEGPFGVGYGVAVLFDAGVRRQEAGQSAASEERRDP
ncbi:MAG: hypothetical protein AB9869_14355 [Verrucomicrobiia bacterium]